ncbi:MAG: phosphatase PAP2 family protein [Thermoguttaceae bacterium]
MQTAEADKTCDSILTSRHRLIVDLPYDGSAKLSAGIQLLWLAVPLTFILAGFVALAVDCPIGRWCVEKNCPASLENLFSTMEPFGNGLGVAIIGITIFCLDPRRRWALPRILGCAYSAGLAANGLKLLVSRTRPHSFDFHGGVLKTFGDWFPMVSAGSIGQSFPSGHTTTAVALAAALVWLYPRGWCLFPALALLVGCQRIQSGAHFLSDVLWGAALGSLIALAFLKIGQLPQWIDGLEEKLKGKDLRMKDEG